MKRQILFLAILSCALCLGASALNTSGFCYSAGRYLTDQDLIAMAVAAEQRLHRSTGTVLSRLPAAEFLAQHPDCCKLDRNAKVPANPLGERLLGLYRVVIDIDYDLPDGEGNRYDAVQVLNACGQHIESFGMALPP